MSDRALTLPVGGWRMGRVLFLGWCGRVTGRALFRLSRVFGYFLLVPVCLCSFAAFSFDCVVGGLGGVL